MATKAENEAYFDAQIRRRIRERRTIAGIVAAILATLEESDRTLAEYLRINLASVAGRPAAQVAERVAQIMAEVVARRRGVLVAIRKTLRAQMTTLAADQPEAEARMLREALGDVEREIAEVDRGEVRDLTLATPFAIREDRSGTLTELFDAVRQSDAAAIRQAIAAALAAGDNLDGMMRRIAGSRSRDFTDGALAQTRRGVAGVAEAGLTHGIETGAAAFWTLNSIVFGTIGRWTTMLDSGVCPTCRARGGKFTTPGGRALPPGYPRLQPASARPPAHLRCRCRMVWFLPGDVPDEPSYPEWLRAQSAETQDDILGPKRGALFRSGKVTLEGFVDARGRELTLEELRAK